MDVVLVVDVCRGLQGVLLHNAIKSIRGGKRMILKSIMSIMVCDESRLVCLAKKS